MFRLLPLCFALLLASCSDEPISEVRNTVELFLGGSSNSEFRDVVFLPANLDKHQADRTVKQCMVMVDTLGARVSIHNIEVKGRWATIKLSSPKPRMETLFALHVDDNWQIFWDPAGTLMWGDQKWHSLLSESDWEDYRRLKNTLAGQGAAPNP